MKIQVKSFGALRFFMISSVFIAHISFIMTNEKATEFFYRYLGNGVFGVAFFFILSGFCLNLGYHDRLRKLDKESYLGFIKRRIIKIFPLYIIMQTLYLIMEIIKNPVADNVKDLLVKYFFSVPLLQMLIPSKQLYISLNAVSWFLSCLFLIYLVAPLIIMVASDIRKKSLMKNVIVIVALILFYRCVVFCSYYFLGEESGNFVNRSPIINLIAFAIGVFVGNLRLKKSTGLQKVRWLCTLLEMVMLVLTVVTYILTTYYTAKIGSQNYCLLRLLVLTLLILVFSYDGGLCSKLFSLRGFDILGNVSFEFYLMHYFVIRAAAVPLQKLIGTGNRDNLLITVLLFIVTWMIAILWNQIPKFHSGKRRKMK